MTGSASTPIGRLLREPLLHFLLLGAGLFVLFSVVNGPAGPAADEVVVSEARVADLAGQFQRVWQRPPTPSELSGLVDAWVREEILYREGVALGLDRDDPVLRRRIAQKMTFISEGLTEEPTEADLRAWLEEHPDEYRIDPVYTFRQVYVAEDGAQRDPAARAADILEALAAGADPEALGDGTLLPAGLKQSTQREVARSFGSDFAEALAAAPLGAWFGPIRSGYGLHLVRVDEARPARMPTLDEARGALLRDLRHARAQQANDAFYQRLLERYDVRYQFSPESAAVAGGVERLPMAGAVPDGS